MTIMDAMVTEMKKTPNLNAGSVESKAYTVGRDVTWDTVKKFYDGELAKSEWTTDPKIAFSQGTVQGQGWLRGKQLFFVYLLAEPALPDPLLITVLGSQN